MLKDKLILFFQSLFTLKKLQYLLIVILGLGLIAFLVISRNKTDNRSKASTNPSQEVEAGLINGSASVQSDAAASGGQYVVFGQAAPTNTPLPPTIAPASATPHAVLGTALDTWNINAAQGNTAKAYGFKFLTPENEMKILFVQPTQGQYNFASGDTLVAFAKQNGMLVHGHTLIWYVDVPGWVSALAPSDRQAAFKDHITTVMKHYCGQIYSMDVVNEALADDGGYRGTVWTGAFGGDGYTTIKTAYETARAACPSIKLYYNDYGADQQNTKSDAMYALASKLKSLGILDGVGFQMHVDTAASVQSITTNFKRFSDLGLEIAVSEMDVQVVTATPSTSQLTSQATTFGGVATACMNNPNCVRFTTWGIDDGSSWINKTFQPDAPLLFDRNFQPKPAWYSVKSALHL